MKLILAFVLPFALLGPCWAAPRKAAPSGPRYVNMEVRRTFTNAYDVVDHGLDIVLYIDVFGGGMNFRGRPITGDLWGSGSYLNFSGAGLTGSVHRWGDNFQVDATVTPPGGRSVRCDFTLYANGRLDDPNRPPYYSLHSSGADLQLSADYRGYRVNGTIDAERFGRTGAALVGIVAAKILDILRDKPDTVKTKARLWESAVIRPALRWKATR